MRLTFGCSSIPEDPNSLTAVNFQFQVLFIVDFEIGLVLQNRQLVQKHGLWNRWQQSLISTGFRTSSSLQMTRGDLGLISTVDIALPSVFTRVNGATADLGGKKVGIGTTRVSQMTSEMS